MQDIGKIKYWNLGMLKLTRKWNQGFILTDQDNHIIGAFRVEQGGYRGDDATFYFDMDDDVNVIREELALKDSELLQKLSYWRNRE